ncbi:MAG: PEP-CTERM sorting domain-containing protein [Caulobacteraceae bacterium]
MIGKHALAASLAAGGLAMAGLCASPATAATYEFKFTGVSAPLTVTGTMATTGVPNGVFGQDVTSMTGAVNGAPFTFVTDPLAPNVATSSHGFTYDDDFDPTTSSFDSNGVVFDIGSTEYNLYNYYPGTYTIAYNTLGSPDYYQVNGSFAVPEPATWTLMLMGMLGMGAVLRRRSRPIGASAAF